MHRISLLLVILATLLVPTQNIRAADSFAVRKKITVDTSTLGLQQAIPSAPLLLRLHDSNFQFEAAREDGGDIRFFAQDGKTPLPFHLEKFDSLLHEGLAWIRLSEIPTAGKLEFWLCYGLASPSSPAGNSQNSYDPDFSLVYHFAERNAPALDSTKNGHQGSAASTSTGTLIGLGTKTGLPLALPNPPTLHWKAGDALTVSFWFKPTAAQPSALLFSRQEANSGVALGLDQETPFLEINGQRVASSKNASLNAWHHLALIAEPGRSTLWLDGEQAATLDVPLPALTSPAWLGADPASGKTSAQADLDELQIRSAAVPASQILFQYASQSPEKASKWILFSEDEVGGGNILGDGYFAIILRNLTVDGWIVIVILAGLGAATGWVVVSKVRLLTRTAAWNKAFLEAWNLSAGQLKDIQPESFGNSLSEEVAAMVRASPLFDLLKIGSLELKNRADATGVIRLNGASMPAVRAVLEAKVIHESDRLSSGMVLLSIAISGGPFLGLLGTVVGVMITFAAVAAAGEVNVNAIAPGIAAALLATVAGLAVAIPALFAYNYLLPRIKNATRDLHLFVEAFTTKASEQLGSRP